MNIIGDQTTEHIMSHCDKFAPLRLQIFGQAEPQPPYTMPLHKVIDFLKAAKIHSLEMYETYKQFLQDRDDGNTTMLTQRQTQTQR